MALIRDNEECQEFIEGIRRRGSNPCFEFDGA